MAAYPRDYQSRYGMLRGVIPEVVDKFMGCGDLAKGFVRARCDECSYLIGLRFFNVAVARLTNSLRSGGFVRCFMR